MIQVEGLSISYQGHPLFTEAGFSIQAGERCGLVGRNGSGKSTLFRLMLGQEMSDAGSISIRKNYRLGALSQHIHFSKPTLLEEASLGLQNQDEESLYLAEKILFGLGFKEDDLRRHPHEFSGGFHLRLHLAKVLLSEPDCLLLDEPTNYLDILSIRWLAKFLKKWKGEFILISHDREFMDSVTTHTLGIHREKVRKCKGGTVAFYEQIVLEEEVHERTRQNLEKKRAHAQSFIDRFGAKATKAAQAQSRQKMLNRIPTLERLKEISQLDFQFNEAMFPGKMMLEAQDLAFSYKPGEKPFLINGITLSIAKGERIAIIGKNGYGKSTILRLLAQDLAPVSGKLKISENLRLGYFGQTNIERLHPENTVEQEVSSANRQLSPTEIKGICGLMMFSGSKAEKTVSVLSGGERSRVLLGKIVASPCNLLMLDEPTHHLDMESIEALIDALEDFQGSVVLVTHSELILRRLAWDKLVVCHKDRQEVFLGGYDDFLDKQGWEEEIDSRPKKEKSDYQASKQQRAELVQARSKALRPIDQEIAAVEKHITKLEVEQQEAQAQFLALTQEGRGQAIQELSKAMSMRSKGLEEAYHKLDKLMQKRDEVALSFDL